MLSQIQQLLPCHPWRNSIHWYDSIGSTNDLARQMAAQGAPAGTVILAGLQTDGHGRLGRSFSSPAGMGVYLSCILRPQCTPDKLMHLTCATAVAAVEAVEQAGSIHPGIKWTNDLVIGNKKLGGILTSLQIDPKTGLVSSAIIGIGINCLQKEGDFPPDIQNLACSLAMHSQHADPAPLAAALIVALESMDRKLMDEKPQIMELYRRNCITLGKSVSWQAGQQLHHGVAMDLDENGGLVLQLPDGSLQTAAFGEVSIRGMYGYL